MKYHHGFAFCLALLLGCGGGVRPPGDLPELQPAGGKVTRSGQPVGGGLLQLHAATATADNNNLIVTSSIGADGGYELSTTHALSQHKASGAPAGKYTVTYLPPGSTQDVMPITLSKTVTIMSGPNELTIELGGE